MNTPLLGSAKAPLLGTELGITIALFLFISIIGFGAARWRRSDRKDLNDWGLGGRSFGGFVTWFLLGGDLYTAYTFIAVPAAMYALGAVSGWFAVAYTILVWPIVFVIMPRLWSVAHRHGYVTPADFVRGRFDSRGLSVATALTGIVATLPYIALQLVGIEAVLQVMGVGTGSGSAFVRDLPLIIAFVVLAAFTYTSGLRAPALIAFVKDALIYVVVIAAVIYLPIHLGGFGHIFGAAKAHFATVDAAAKAAHKPPPATFIPSHAAYLSYATLALGSAMALFMYPHAITGVLSTKSRDVVRRNTAFLPAYSLILALIALLGYMAIAAGVKTTNPRLVAPLLFEKEFPHWFAGIAFSAIAIGALVPAAIMSIAAANLFARNIWRDVLRPGASESEQARVSKVASLVVKFGALAFALGLNTQNAINLQLLGGVWILQTFPSVVFGLFTRWFHRWALLLGWAAGMGYGTYEAYLQSSPVAKHFGGSIATVPGLDQKAYIAVTALVLNVAVAGVLSVALRLVRAGAGTDATVSPDYVADVTGPVLAPSNLPGVLMPEA
ncbi:MAG: monocarboxylate uptake permease MctP [Acidimicrobiales bacterium]